MGKKENKIEQPVSDYAEEKGFLVRKYNTPGVKGAPDRIFIGHGTVFFIEFKEPIRGVVGIHQTREIRYIRERGVKVFIVDNIEVGKDIIDGAIIVQTRMMDSGCL